jgi:alkaline phosphatase D
MSDPFSALTRRTLLCNAFAAATAGLAGPITATAAVAPRLAADPFQMLGLASGDPTPGGIVLWTRLALDLADTDRWGLGENAYAVNWEVRDAEHPSAAPVRKGRAIAARERGYALHVEIDGLKPWHAYDYRFTLGDYGIAGRTRTAPAAGADLEKLRFAFCSCNEYENELYFAYRAMAEDKPDFVVHLGDYIYEATYRHLRRPGEGRRLLKWDGEAPVRTLAQYRRRYAEYKAEPESWLKAMHAAAPFITGWDDHEVSNDYAGTSSEMRDEKGFLARLTAAYRAYFENLPVRLSWLPQTGGGRRLHRQFGFGRLTRLYMLDTRQHRSPQACPWGSKRGGRLVSALDCPDIEAETRAMLGRPQMNWLTYSMGKSDARWNLIGQGVPFAVLDARRAPTTMSRAIGSRRDLPHVWTDSWSGHLADYRRVADLMARHRAKNPVVLSGDIHAHLVNRIWSDWTKPGQSAPVAPELVTAAISSNLRDLSELADANKDTVAYYDGRHHGYVLCELSREALTATMVTIKDKDPAAKSARADRSVRFRIAAGDPEPRRV